MRRFLFVVAVLSASSVIHGGAVYETADVPWVTNVSELDLDNDDYVGDFDGSPNKFNLNWHPHRGSIFSFERIIPTVASRGITEYAMAIGGWFDVADEFPPPTSLDSRFQILLGFGTGENFVRASGLVPELRFDSSDNVSPPVEDLWFWVGDNPILSFIKHETDTLTYQGRTCIGGSCMGSFSWNDYLRMPIDIPNLDAGLRDYYTADELSLISEDAVPFTIRMLAIPEPCALTLAVLGLLTLVGFPRRLLV
jgi:hypothetical protein